LPATTPLFAYIRTVMAEQAIVTDAPLPKYNLTEDQEKKEILRQYRSLLRSLRPKLKKGDKELVRHAFEMSAEAHQSMRRKSGEPYILHPIAVAHICITEIGLGVRSTICCLLHDTVEDTDITLEDVQREFGNEIGRSLMVLPRSPM
jgi:guanosine-3',5'-bis(diphosphate) 3'-pyrophosphohydrolase